MVEVSDNGNGTLHVETRKVDDKEQELKFSNTYTATGVAQVEANKVLTGKTRLSLRAVLLHTGEYWFCTGVQRDSSE